MFKGGNELGLQEDVNRRSCGVSRRANAAAGWGREWICVEGGEEAVAVEADGSGTIHLLSWDGARKGFNLQLFGADELSGGGLS